jgi:hypothetical protein
MYWKPRLSLPGETVFLHPTIGGRARHPGSTLVFGGASTDLNFNVSEYTVRFSSAAIRVPVALARDAASHEANHDER